MQSIRFRGLRFPLVLLFSLAIVPTTPIRAVGVDAVTLSGTISVPLAVPTSSATSGTVTLFVVPNPQFQESALASGRPIRISEIASSPVDSNGSYALSLDTAALPPEFVSDDGHIEVMIAASAGGRIRTWEVPAQVGQVVR